ncbi:hypothetical protein Y1Q_0017206 [Alligator mississippiensis]|uniref:Uncharacterized protein n=1 Tax=Alligator mississippiensis TaxID=8496 RepID=A0A151NKQ6_ALLMI|nr:hypothetical protein Y1Q_0017206 [Alligator mississippiensis]
MSRPLLSSFPTTSKQNGKPQDEFYDQASPDKRTEADGNSDPNSGKGAGCIMINYQRLQPLNSAKQPHSPCGQQSSTASVAMAGEGIPTQLPHTLLLSGNQLLFLPPSLLGEKKEGQQKTVK